MADEKTEQTKQDPPKPQILSQVAPAKGGKTGPRKGEKSKRWDKDPVILARLESVSQMLLRGAKLWQIAEAFQYSITTAKKDVVRVRLLWADEARDKVSDNRDRSIAELRSLQTVAWAEYDKNKKNLGALREIRECERLIVELQGTRAPLVVDLTKMSDAELVQHIASILGVQDSPTQPDRGATTSPISAGGREAQSALVEGGSG